MASYLDILAQLGYDQSENFAPPDVYAKSIFQAYQQGSPLISSDPNGGTTDMSLVDQIARIGMPEGTQVAQQLQSFAQQHGLPGNYNWMPILRATQGQQATTYGDWSGNDHADQNMQKILAQVSANMPDLATTSAAPPPPAPAPQTAAAPVAPTLTLAAAEAPKIDTSALSNAAPDLQSSINTLAQAYSSTQDQIKSLADALKVPPPTVSQPTPMPTVDDAAASAARRRSIAQMMQRGGRASTILTADSLGG